MAQILPFRPTDATLSVTKAARLLGVHPNTVRAWSDRGRLRFYRINPRGDRRYRLGDLQRFLAAAERTVQVPAGTLNQARRRGGQPAVLSFGGLARPARSGLERSPDSIDDLRRRLELVVLGRLAGAAAERRDLDATLTAAVRLIRESFGYRAVVAYELRGDVLVARASSSADPARLPDIPALFGVLGRALESGHAATTSPGEQQTLRSGGDVAQRPSSVLGGDRAELAVPIAGGDAPWGVLLIGGDDPGSLSEADSDFAEAAAAVMATLVKTARLADDVRHQMHRADALRRVASDIGSRLDLGQILAGIVDHAMVLFEADRAAVFLRRPDGGLEAEVSRGLSTGYLASARAFPARSLPAAAVSARRPLFAVGYSDDVRATESRAAVVQEGFNTICSAPLFDGDDLLGTLDVYHDASHPWTGEELETIAAFATQAAVAIKTAQNYSQMATWAAQLQSIQQLGVRLSQLTSVREIGLAIATELRQLIDYHNVRVYQVSGDDLVPVAMQGQVGEYVDETPDQLRVKIGEGITGWVAARGIPQNLPDAAKDPRANTIPGTQDDLDESMLLAPMLFEDEVIGVVVLAKLGLNQFSDGDLRLLVIYASFAAQAIANAETTERLRAQSATLERQLLSQRELLHITESILTTLDPRAVLELIAERLSDLVANDNLAIEVADPITKHLTPLTARGIHADQYMEAWAPGETGIATWVVANNEPVLIVDERHDPRVNHFGDDSTRDGSLIVVPLRGREGATGVLTLERLGAGNVYTDDEFELVKLFAAQVSIALQNAEVHHAVTIRARTDEMTGLLNHGTFQERLRRSVDEGSPFSIVMLDLDDFKGVNDALGHQAGDELLREIGAAIVGAGRDTDHVFRYGGDEFVMILPGTDPTNADLVAHRVRDAVHAIGREGSRWAAEEIEVSASLGTATFPIDGQTAESVLLAADRACFVAKRAGQGMIGTAIQGLALAAEFSLSAPTPVDPPTPEALVAAGDVPGEIVA